MSIAYLLLGGNEGDRIDWLNKAIASIEANCGTIIERSAIYETAAWGIEDQPAFLNMALSISTELSPEELLYNINKIEAELGRQRQVKWGQRTLDIDILFYDDKVITSQRLTIPHPEMQNRRFALEPLKDIAPGFIHPKLNKTVSQMLADCEDPLAAEKWEG